MSDDAKRALGGISNNPDFVAGLVHALDRRVDSNEATLVELRSRVDRLEREQSETKKAMSHMIVLLLEASIGKAKP